MNYGELATACALLVRRVVKLAATVLVLAAAMTSTATASPDVSAAAPASQAVRTTAYLQVGGETVFVDRAGDTRHSSDARGVFLFGAGYRVWSSMFVHAALGVDGNHVGNVLESRLGPEVRLGGRYVRAILGVDAGTMKDWHPWNQSMENIAGFTLFPRAGVEVGTHTLWLRGMIEEHVLLGSNGGHSASGGATIGHDF